MFILLILGMLSGRGKGVIFVGFEDFIVDIYRW